MPAIAPASRRTHRQAPGSLRLGWLFLPPGALPAQLHSPGILPRAENTPLAPAGTSLAPGSRCSHGSAPSDPAGSGRRLSCRCWADGSTSHCLGSWRGSAKAAPVSRNKISREAAGPSTNWQTWQAARCPPQEHCLLSISKDQGGTGMNVGVLMLLQPAGPQHPLLALAPWLLQGREQARHAQGAQCIS